MSTGNLKEHHCLGSIDTEALQLKRHYIISLARNPRPSTLGFSGVLEGSRKPAPTFLVMALEQSCPPPVLHATARSSLPVEFLPTRRVRRGAAARVQLLWLWASAVDSRVDNRTREAAAHFNRSEPSLRILRRISLTELKAKSKKMSLTDPVEEEEKVEAEVEVEPRSEKEEENLEKTSPKDISDTHMLSYNAAILDNFPDNMDDPGVPIISCLIDTQKFDQAL
jgi:hypothetical protein